LWNNQESQKKFVEWAAKQLKVKTLNDWYAVERQAIEAIGGTPFFLFLFYIFFSLPNFPALDCKLHGLTL
jgi:hypothetical protein